MSVVQSIGVHHVAINVDDVPAAVAFYRDVLGLRLREDRPDFGIAGAWLDAGDQQVHLIQAPLPTSAGQHFALRVVDVDRAAADLRARGIEVSEPATGGPNRQCFLRDPCGNAVELNQPAT